MTDLGEFKARLQAVLDALPDIQNYLGDLATREHILAETTAGLDERDAELNRRKEALNRQLNDMFDKKKGMDDREATLKINEQKLATRQDDFLKEREDLLTREKSVEALEQKQAGLFRQKEDLDIAKKKFVEELNILEAEKVALQTKQRVLSAREDILGKKEQRLERESTLSEL